MSRKNFKTPFSCLPADQQRPWKDRSWAACGIILAEDGVEGIPDEILAKTFARLLLDSGTLAGSAPVLSADNGHRRRNYLVSIASSVRQQASNGTVEVVGCTTYGLVQHYALVFVDGKARADAFVERTVSAADPQGKYGIPGKRFGLDCLSGFDGHRRYVPIGSIVSVVRTILSRERHFLLNVRQPFSGWDDK